MPTRWELHRSRDLYWSDDDDAPFLADCLVWISPDGGGFGYSLGGDPGDGLVLGFSTEKEALDAAHQYAKDHQPKWEPVPDDQMSYADLSGLTADEINGSTPSLVLGAEEVR